MDDQNMWNNESKELTRYSSSLYINRVIALPALVQLLAWPRIQTAVLSQMQDIVTKINILLQEIHDIKLQKLRNNIFDVHKTHPKDTDEGNVQGDTHLFYNSASTHLLPNKLNILEHHVPNPNHVPSIDDSAFVQQKPNPYMLWSTAPPELLSSSSSDEDLMDDNTDCARYALMKTSLPLKRVGRGEGKSEMEGEQETRGGMEGEPPDLSSGAVTKPLSPEPGSEAGCC